MKQVKQIVSLLLFGLMTLSIQGYYSGEIPDGIKSAFKSGNSKETAKYFNSSIELDILGNENVYSKNQAEQIIKSFYEQHPVTNFSILFEGGKDASQYAIGKLVTSKGTFRVNLLVKGQIILQLRIEEENGD